MNKLTQQLEQEWIELRKLREAEQPAQQEPVAWLDPEGEEHMTKQTEAMKLAKAWFERNTYGDEAVDVYEALCAALTEQPAPAAKPDCGARMPCGTSVSNVYDAYEAGRRAALAEQPAQQEPVAWRWVNSKGWLTYGEASHDTFRSTPLYATPPAAQRTWVGLTDEDIAVALTGDASLGTRLDELTPSWIELVRAVETKLKAKNT